MSEPPFTIQTLAARWGMNHRTVMAHIACENVKVFRLGKLIRISHDEVLRCEKEGLPNIVAVSRSSSTTKRENDIAIRLARSAEPKPKLAQTG